MIDDARPYTFDRVVRILITAGVLLALYWLVVSTASVLIPLAVGVLLAYLLNPLVDLVERRIRNRTAAVLVTVGALFSLLLIAGILLVPRLSGEFGNFVHLLLSLVEPGSEFRGRMKAALPTSLVDQIEAALAEQDLQSFLREHRDIGAFAVSAVRWAVPQLLGVVSGTLALLGTFMQVLLVGLYLVFILIDYRSLKGRWKGYLPPRYRENVVSFLDEFNAAMSQYFRGQFVVAMIVGVLFAVGFTIVGIRMGILLGLFIGILNMVPYLQLVGVPPALLLGIMTAVEKGQSVWWYLIGVAIVFAVVQGLQDAVITPRVMGKATGLRPVVILFSVLFWGKLLGFLGLLLAIPLTCLGIAYYRRFITRQQAEMDVESAPAPMPAPSGEVPPNA